MRDASVRSSPLARLRDPFSAVSHLAGAVTALVSLVALLALARGREISAPSLVVYGTSLFLLFSASGVYHGVRAGPRATLLLRKADHAAIYLLIAGSYTPFCVNAFDGFWREGMLAIIWGLALVGITVKLFFMRAPRWVDALVYVIMGWLSIFAIGEMLAQLSPLTTGWLFAGGVIYTLGALVYATKRLNFWPGRFGFHEVWHIFVLLAAAAHYIAVLSLVLSR